MAYVMIVDDDSDFATAAATALRRAGLEVAIEPTTGSAKTSMQARPPDLVILDVMFSEDISAGFELARAMRHCDDRLKDIPILMLTAVNARFPLGFSRQDIDEEWLPVSDFVEKPVDLRMLLGRVEALLRQRTPQT